ncbi:glycosyltransferase family 2 protein [Metabacillus sp. 84]|uniref:glycosyltransferase family 2 protein n=1 Tax=unclassified Metabacillus TaxID=2675274 RepID=UPI003CE7E088
MKTLTVFTPTYNRAYCLGQCYESLKRQSNKDFDWLIIDDGSTDRTKELVDSWIEENVITIRYIWQKNQGMHGAHNTAYENIDTELNVCIDSDDYLAKDAVDKIVSFWKNKGSQKYAGIIGLDASPSGEIIGTSIPEHITETALTDLYVLHKVRGDKKLVYRTDLIKSVPPYPLFKGEKYCPLNIKYILIEQEYPLLVLNEVLCHVEYREDGSSLNMLKQYKNNPNGFLHYRKVAMKYAPSFPKRLRESMHYVSGSLLLKEYLFLFKTPHRIEALLVTPMGIALYFYIQFRNRKNMLGKNQVNN